MFISLITDCTFSLYTFPKFQGPCALALLVYWLQPRRFINTHAFLYTWTFQPFKNKKLVFFWYQSEARTAATVWNWSGKTLSPGALLAVFYFSSRHIFPPVWTFPRPHYLPLGLRGWMYLHVVWCTLLVKRTVLKHSHKKLFALIMNLVLRL